MFPTVAHCAIGGVVEVLRPRVDAHVQPRNPESIRAQPQRSRAHSLQHLRCGDPQQLIPCLCGTLANEPRKVHAVFAVPLRQRRNQLCIPTEARKRDHSAARPRCDEVLRKRVSIDGARGKRGRVDDDALEGSLQRTRGERRQLPQVRVEWNRDQLVEKGDPGRFVVSPSFEERAQRRVCCCRIRWCRELQCPRSEVRDPQRKITFHASLASTGPEAGRANDMTSMSIPESPEGTVAL